MKENICHEEIHKSIIENIISLDFRIPIRIYFLKGGKCTKI